VPIVKQMGNAYYSEKRKIYGRHSKCIGRPEVDKKLQ
jgi:hypothetical protein